ncbi:Signal recognition particle 9 kDa protein [Temnothorax longispinosus]|uniref:Signal recognition particle 9 kDa protein n=1 Tax=Temnothorax longispinosus TaxID=300112 RepID=A0A4S2KJH4_9HYME|nr:Signal recognition particle 9 kDa protein [Temnothorax longispinosus]
MTYLSSWEEFERGAERLYLQDPINVRFYKIIIVFSLSSLAPFTLSIHPATRYTMKYCHSKGVLCLKLTDNRRCLQYKTEIAQDLKKMEKFIGNLMRHMASKDS